jgi:hypothetical protein
LGAARLLTVGETGLVTIRREEVLDILLAACPLFAETWDPADNVYQGERLLYVDASDFTRCVMDLIASGASEQVSSAFDAVERLVVHGDGFVSELAKLGILESLQNGAGSAGLDAEVDIAPRLGPISRRDWDLLNRSWTTFGQVNRGELNEEEHRRIRAELAKEAEDIQEQRSRNANDSP